jgi:hypothetical protein
MRRLHFCFKLASTSCRASLVPPMVSTVISTSLAVIVDSNRKLREHPREYLLFSLLNVGKQKSPQAELHYAGRLGRHAQK